MSNDTVGLFYMTQDDAQRMRNGNAIPSNFSTKMNPLYCVPFTIAFDSRHIKNPPFGLHLQTFGRARRPDKLEREMIAAGEDIVGLVKDGYLAPLRAHWPIECRWPLLRHRLVWNAEYQRWEPSETTRRNLEHVNPKLLDGMFKFAYRMNTLNKGKRHVRN